MYMNHSNITVILKGHEDSPLVYKDAILNSVDFDVAIVITCHVNLPVNEDKT